MTDTRPNLESMVAAADEAVQRQQQSGASPSKKPAGAAIVAVAAVVALSAVLYLRGEAAFNPKPDEGTVLEGRANAIADAQRRVFDAWDRTGRLPVTLTEVGPPQPLIVYTPGDSSFRLSFERMVGDSAHLTYTRFNRTGTTRNP